MSGSVAIAGASLGTQLQQLLMADDIVPGADASYQVCKTSAECLNGMACIGQPCLGTVIYTCGGLIPPNRCQ